jgi:quercetin dioxygenase-like cupin family protein
MNRRQFTGMAALTPFVPFITDMAAKPANQPLVVLPDSARTYDIGGGGQARILVGGQHTANNWWLGTLLSAPGRKTSLHVHFSAAEQFYVLEGLLSVWLDDRWLDLPAGSVAAVPPRIPHALGNRSHEPVRFLASGNPAGFERFFADIEKLASTLPYASKEFLAQLAVVYTKYDSKLLGPPPQG